MIDIKDVNRINTIIGSDDGKGKSLVDVAIAFALVNNQLKHEVLNSNNDEIIRRGCRSLCFEMRESLLIEVEPIESLVIKMRDFYCGFNNPVTGGLKFDERTIEGMLRISPMLPNDLIDIINNNISDFKYIYRIMKEFQ